MEFGDVEYWDNLCGIMGGARPVYSTLHICWERRRLSATTTGSGSTRCRKSFFGVFPMVEYKNSILFRDSTTYSWPHSRHTTVRRRT